MPEGLTATGDMAAVVTSCEVVLSVIPTPFVARTIAGVADKFRPDGILVSCTKGILNDTLETRECDVVMMMMTMSNQQPATSISSTGGRGLRGLVQRAPFTNCWSPAELHPWQQLGCRLSAKPMCVMLPAW